MRIGWTASEHLMCVQDDGVAIMYDIFGNVEKKFDMGEVCDHFIYLVIAEHIILRLAILILRWQVSFLKYISATVHDITGAIKDVA